MRADVHRLGATLAKGATFAQLPDRGDHARDFSQICALIVDAAAQLRKAVDQSRV